VGEKSVRQMEESERMVEMIERFGSTAKLTVYPEAKHDSWTETACSAVDVEDIFFSGMAHTPMR